MDLMNTTYELNDAHRDSDLFSNKFSKQSPVSEVFSAMVDGKEVSSCGTKADKCVRYIRNLGERANNGDGTAVVELNALRRFKLEGPIMQEIKLLSIFGSYTQIAADDSVEREVYVYAGERSREQAAGGDVVFPVITKEIYPVPTFTVSGGYAMDYRRVAAGDMSAENEGLNQVRIDIRNRALLGVTQRVYKAIKNATGIKYILDEAGLTKTNVDAVLTKLRRWGKLSIVADYAIISQFIPWVGYVGQINSNTITGISEAVMNQLAANGTVSMYLGCILSELPNPYDIYSLTDDGTNFKPLLPAGLGWVFPTGVQSPVATFSRGGLTSLTGKNIKNGKIENRFDLEVAVDVAKGQEYKIGMLYDSNISGLA